MKITKRCFVMLMCVIMVFCLCACGRITVNGQGTGTVVYHFMDTNFEEPLTEAEVEAVAEILNGKQTASVLSGTPSCGFNRDIAIIIDGRRFLMACDKCGTLQDGLTLGYINISDEERQVLEEIFTSRGGQFPCI